MDIDAEADTPSLRQLSSLRASDRQLEGMRILVVEDNLINQQIAEELLSAEGAIVSMAANGQLGVDAVRSAAPQFDVVLMDVQMPVMDGYAATTAIRNDLGLDQLPIIAMTANAMASDRDTCIASGMNEHIGKPFDMAKLVSLLIRTTGITPASAYQPTHKETQASAMALLPAIDGIDLRGAIARMSGSKALFARTARDFLKLLPAVYAELSAHLAVGNMQQLVMRLHTLKGNAATLGLTQLAAEAKLLEQRCINGQGLLQSTEGWDGLETHLANAMHLLERAISAIQPDASMTEGRCLSSSSREEIIGALEALDLFLAQSDMEALQTFAESRDVLLALPDQIFGSLEAAIQDLDMELAHQICLSAKALLANIP